MQITAQHSPVIHINAPEWFEEREFLDWLNGSDVLTMHKKGDQPNEWSDVFVFVDPGLSGEGSDQDSMPSKYWDFVVSVCRSNFQVSYGFHVMVRITNMVECASSDFHLAVSGHVERVCNSVDVPAEFTDLAIEDDVASLVAAEEILSGAVDLIQEGMKGLKGQNSAFCDEVKKLQRPYIKISDSRYSELSDGLFDYYLLASGAVVTFGAADGGYALMPLSTDAANEIKIANNIPISA